MRGRLHPHRDRVVVEPYAVLVLAEQFVPRDRRTDRVGAALDEPELRAGLGHRNGEGEPLAVAHQRGGVAERVAGDEVERAALVVGAPASPVVDGGRELEELRRVHAGDSGVQIRQGLSVVVVTSTSLRSSRPATAVQSGR